MQINRNGWVGLVLIALGIVPLTCWTVWFHTRTWCPVDMPISLVQGNHFSTREFFINLNAQYAIDIRARGTIPVDDLACMVGNQMRVNCPIPSVVRMHWALASDGTVVQGSSDGSRGGGASYSDGEAFRSIGYFVGQKGRRYKLDIDVLADGSSLQAMNPRLQVTINDPKYESGLVLSGLLRLVGMIFGLVGGAVLVISVLKQRRGSSRLSADPRAGPP